MRKRLFKSVLVVIALFISLFFGSITVNAQSSKISELDLSKIYGEFDFDSKDYTTVIVEIEDESIIQAKHNGKVQTKRKLEEAREFITKDIFEVVPSANLIREYDYLFSGFALELPGSSLINLLEINGIRAIYPNVHYDAEVVEMDFLDEVNPNMQESNPYVGAPDAWALGYTGAGITVAVIDTGVDYNHPELIHAFDDYKGYDFYDNDYDPINPYDPINGTQFHGTHVAGTIAASSFGIAPDARLLAYRVLGPNGGSSTQVIAGIEQAVMDGADVMNLSLGNALNDPDYATSIALDWAMAEGVVAVTSSGNEGPNLWTVGSPGASREAISVGSIALPFTNYTLGFETLNYNDYPSLKVMGTSSDEDLLALDGNTYSYEFVGLGTKEEFANVDVKGKVALIMRGEITFLEKSQNALDNGAVAAIIFNNALGEINASGIFALPTFQLTFDDGYKMYEELSLGNNQLTINASVDYTPALISDFSSNGPAFGTWMIKPDIVAPGDYVLSTYPGGYYAYAGGTSMASPHVAAGAALILQAHSDYSPDEVKAVLMNTANRLIDPDTNKPYLHNEQGSGCLDILESITTDTIVNPGSISFGKFIKMNGKQVEGGFIEIQNLADYTKNYTITSEFYGISTGVKLMTSNNLKLNAGQTKSIRYNLQVDNSILKPGSYQGVIKLSEGQTEIIIPIILFIQEPDYPRVTLAGVSQISMNEFIPYAYVLAGAEYLEMAIYSFDAVNGSIGNYLGYWDYAFDVSPGLYQFEIWDGTVQQGNRLPSGEYVIIAYAEYLGKATTIAYLFSII